MCLWRVVEFVRVLFAEGVWRDAGEDVWEVLSAEADRRQLQFTGQQLVLRLRAQRTKPLPGESETFAA